MVRNRREKIMRDVLLALTPALVFSVVAFGWSALAVTCISVASCVLFEYLIQKFLLKGPCTVSDLSAVVTGVLLAFNLPASLPWWIVVIGAFVSIAIAKMTFGGWARIRSIRRWWVVCSCCSPTRCR